MKQLFKSQSNIFKERILNEDSRIASEKIFIINFFKSLPLEDLKRLVNFNVVDFENEQLWNDSKNHELLSELRYKNVMQYSCELELDNGVDDLFLGQIMNNLPSK